MRVLVAHNRYRSATPSGENRVVESEIDLLREGGVDVVPYVEDSDEIERRDPLALLTAATGPVVSPRGVRRFTALLEQHEPDVVHLHNPYPLISPWVVRSAKRHGVPVVQTVHNYRHTCVAGTHLREGRICEDCVGSALRLPAVRHRCYRGSALQSAAMAAGAIVHGRTWTTVDRFLVTSPAMSAHLVDLGIAPSAIEWRAPFTADPGVVGLPRGGGVAFVGRLDEQKGVRLLLDAWDESVAARWGRLDVVGDGPLADLVRQRHEIDSSVRWWGSLDPAGVAEVMAGASLVVLPSMSFEGFPRVAAESMALGRPLVVWEGLGIAPLLAGAGAAWTAEGTSAAWRRRLLELGDDALAPAACHARAFYDAHCSPQASLAQLLGTYATLARR